MPSLESLPLHNAKTERYPEPLVPAGALDGLEFVEVTPVIGREYPRVNLVNDILHAEKSDALLRDLAIASE